MDFSDRFHGVMALEACAPGLSPEGDSQDLQKTPPVFDHSFFSMHSAHPDKKLKPCPFHIGNVYIDGSQVYLLHISRGKQ